MRTVPDHCCQGMCVGPTVEDNLSVNMMIQERLQEDFREVYFLFLIFFNTDGHCIERKSQGKPFCVIRFYVLIRPVYASPKLWQKGMYTYRTCSEPQNSVWEMRHLLRLK